MTHDEYVEMEIALGTVFILADGIWWRKVHPFFCQPIFPFVEIDPNSIKLPWPALIGGYKHAVSDENQGNSRMHYFIWDKVQEYSIEKLPKRNRMSIRKGTKYITVKQIVDINEFVAQGYQVYLSFYFRTRYKYKCERTDQKCFEQWARILFSQPKIKIFGAYLDGQLCAFEITYLLQDVLIDATFISSSEALKYRVDDVMTNTLRENAAVTPGVKYIYVGTVSGKRTLDEYKMKRGCKLVSKPAYCHTNPIAGYLLKKIKPEAYRKLKGEIDFGMQNCKNGGS